MMWLVRAQPKKRGADVDVGNHFQERMACGGGVRMDCNSWRVSRSQERSQETGTDGRWRDT